MSSRSNEDRLGVDEGLLETAPTLKFVVPTDFVNLPSKGKFYPTGHALYNQEVVEIRHMTAKDEDILTSRTLLKKGVALDRMLQNLIVDKTIKLNDLLIGDKNALVVATRINGYGADYNTEIKCPSCGEKQEYTFDLNNLHYTTPGEELYNEYNVTTSNNNTFLVPLPKTDYVVELKLLTGADEQRLTGLTTKRKKHKLPEAIRTDQLKSIIASINGVTDKNIVNDFIDSLPALDSRYLRTVYAKIMPAMDVEHFECAECEFQTTLEVPFTTDFFWPQR